MSKFPADLSTLGPEPDPDRRMFMYDDLIEWLSDILRFKEAGWGILPADKPPNFGYSAFIGEGEEEISAYMVIPLMTANRFFSYHPKAREVENPFAKNETRRALTEVDNLRNFLRVLRAAPDERPTVWELLLEDD